MAEKFKRQVLSYRGPPPQGVSIPEGPAARRWRYRRILFRIGLFVVVATVTIHFGTNLFMFHKLTALAPADFVQDAQSQCLPTVRAIKQYQRDTGRLPDRLADLVPGYLSLIPRSDQDIDVGLFEKWAVLNHRIIYDFTPGSEGWSVRGPFANGPIPLPPVKIGPATRPAPRPN